MEVNKMLSEDIISRMQKDIKKSADREIFIVGIIDKKQKLVTDYNLLARGNNNMVPAIISDLKPGTILIHNHPSGDLSPSAADIRIASRVGNKGIGFAIISNEVNEIYVVVEPKIPEEESPLASDEIFEIFKPGGQLEEKMKYYEYRSQQLEVVNEVIKSFNKHQAMMVEAGTGTGKSFAYLIPALFWSNSNNNPVVVSTNTINLQEQLIEKDLVFLKKILPFSFKAVLVKGRWNYLCLRKFKQLEKRAHDIFADDENKEEQFIKILNWVKESENGSRSDLNFIVDSQVWEKVCSETDLCLRTNCPYFDQCYFMKARKEIYSADLLVVNHYLLISDALLKYEHGDEDIGILPEYKNLILDEAHNFPDIATDHLGKAFYLPAYKKYLSRLFKDKYSFVPRLRDKISRLKIDEKTNIYKILDQKIIALIQKLNELGIEYQNCLNDFLDEEKNVLRITEDIRDKKEWFNLKENAEVFLDSMQKLGLNLNKTYKILINQENNTVKKLDELLIELESRIYKCQYYIERLDFNQKASDDEYVFWLEREHDLIKQENSPLKINKILNDIIWENLDSLFLTSATLTVNGSFNFLKNILGLENSLELVVSSPFDYSKQAQLIIPDDIPPANSNNFLKKIMKEFKELLLKFGGNTLVLFTSYSMLNHCQRSMENFLNKNGINLLVQGEYPRNYIINYFKNNSRQIIFGTVSFWEGIDVRGEDLKYLIIMKLPFPVPSEPVAAARMEKMKDENKNPFYNYSLPRAVIRFKQGFGRLIRSRDDRGVIITFDNRIIKKSYGNIFLKSLPEGCPLKVTAIKDIKNKI